MDAAEYKHVVLGLIFLKYISDSFNDLYEKLKNGEGEYEGADPEDPNEYSAENVFYVPEKARWSYLQGRSKLGTIGKDVDDAMEAIEDLNPGLRGVLPKEYAKEKLDKQSLGGLIDLIGTKNTKRGTILLSIPEAMSIAPLRAAVLSKGLLTQRSYSAGFLPAMAPGRR